LPIVAACSDDDPASDDGDPPLESSTWSVTSMDLAADDITGFRVFFDDDRNVISLRYTIGGTDYTYAGSIIGSGSVTGDEVEIDIDWGINNDFEFLGTFSAGGDEAIGAVGYEIKEDGEQYVGFGDGTIARQ
jgi:hypothetical protein